MANGPDILVIGGGIIGLTCAIRLREAGATVAVYDRGDLGREASWAGAGIIPPGNPDRAATPLDKLRAIGSATLPDVSAELANATGIDNGYRINGGLEFLTPADEYAVELWRAEGVAFERWDGPRLRDEEPGLSPPHSTCYHLSGMGQVRNPWHLRALIAHARDLGIALSPHTGVEGWCVENGRVRGVQLASGNRVTADRFLLAAGPWSERHLNDLNCRPTVRPIRGQILLLKTEAALLRRTLIDDKRYLVPRGDGRILVGSTEEPEAGFEKRTTEVGLANLHAFARTIVPALANAKVEASWAGLRPGSPDGMPFIGRVPGHDNVLAATGHSRAGIQLSLGTAQLVTELIFDRPTCVPKDAFALARRPDLQAKPAFRS
ncbi:NAD(P)/FAD-dependent oxidoreductase [Limnoglobus roseus]|nr:FAD-dependent oxidoreductase [Limnoglobus roseus]